MGNHRSLAVAALALSVVVSAACPPPEPAVDCSANTDCDDDELCVAGDCLPLGGGGEEGEGEGEEGEGEGEEGEGEEGEGEGAVVCGDGVIGGDEGCDDGDGADDDALDGCLRCAITAPVVDVVVGDGGFDSIPLPLFITSAGPDHVAVVDVAGVYLAEVLGDGSLSGFTRVAGAGAISKALRQRIDDGEASLNELFAAGANPIDDVTRCPDGSVYLASSRSHVVLRVDATADPSRHGVVVFAGTGQLETDFVDPPNFVYPGAPTTVEMTPYALACGADGTVYVATGDEGEQVLAISSAGVVSVALGRRGSVGDTPAHNVIDVEVLGVSVDVDGTLLVVLKDGSSRNGRVVRVVVASGSVTDVAGGGAGNPDFTLGTAATATSVRIEDVVDVEADGRGGFWVVHSGRFVWHVDAAGSMRRVGQEIPITLQRDFDDLAVPHIAAAGDDVVFFHDGTLVRVTATAGRTRLGTPRLFPMFQANVDDVGIVAGTGASSLFAIDADGTPRVLLDADDALILPPNAETGFFLGGLRTATATVSAVGFFGSTLNVHRAAGVTRFAAILGIVTAMAPSATDVDVAWVLDDACRLFRFDVAGAPPANPRSSIAGCAGFEVGDTFGELQMRPVALDVIRGQDIAGTQDDLLLLIDDVGRVVRAPVNADNDGPTQLIAGNGPVGAPGDRGPALGARFNRLTAIAGLANGDVVVGDSGAGRLLAFARGGEVRVVAGAGRGFRDGPAATALFGEILQVTETGVDGSLLIVEPTAVRRYDATAGTVTTILGRGSFGDADTGDLDDARLGEPLHVACTTATSCAVADGATRSLRHIDLDAGSVTTTVGVEGFDLGRVGGLSVQNGAWIFSQPDDDVVQRVVDVDAGTLTPAAQSAAFVIDPTVVAGTDDGLLFASALTSLKRVGTPTGSYFGGAFGPINDVDVDGAAAVMAYGGNGDVYLFAANVIVDDFEDTTQLLLSASARSAAIAGDVVAFADDDGVHVARVLIAGDGEAPLVDVVDVDVPVAAAVCISDLDIVDDVLFVADRCSGSLLRVRFVPET